jgi:hypothetical protein
LDIAKRALSKGYAIEDIQDLTGLSLEDINSLQTE